MLAMKNAISFYIHSYDLKPFDNIHQVKDDSREAFGETPTAHVWCQLRHVLLVLIPMIHYKLDALLPFLFHHRYSHHHQLPPPPTSHGSIEATSAVHRARLQKLPITQYAHSISELAGNTTTSPYVHVEIDSTLVSPI